MTKSPGMRQYLGLAIGLLVGVAGALLFQQSLPPEEGSMQEQLEEVEAELRVVSQRNAVLEAEGTGRRGRRSVRDGMRTIAEKIRDGEDVSLDDIFWTMKPWMRDMAPLFDRMRALDQDNNFDALAGDLSRRYDLSPRDERALKDWLVRKSEENAREFNEVIFSDTSGFVDFVRASRFDEQDLVGIDEFMESRLEGEELAQFKAERLGERISHVQAEANRRLHRIDGAVDLDNDQLDEMFGVMARGSKRFEPGMEFDGMGGETGRLEGADREAAIRAVLRPDQLRRYEAYQQERKEDAEREMRRMGLSLPKDWQLLDDEGF
ncbi:MAG: hypothetical protein HKN82_05620 [Akkermansiaceae bacterium]|nr:hypothetical protein [Akkermansiaceae bacterium]NNM28336.1 hypothetical protein [Akkermansiaceae bacterium]